MTDEERYPLGKPVNREPAQALRPIAGRPGWFLDSHDVEHYVEPDRKESAGSASG